MDRNYTESKKGLRTFVATREGGVDRNLTTKHGGEIGRVSPPARVAWIETGILTISCGKCVSRHPRGWRG